MAFARDQQEAGAPLETRKSSQKAIEPLLLVCLNFTVVPQI